MEDTFSMRVAQTEPENYLRNPTPSIVFWNVKLAITVEVNPLSY